MSHLKTDEEARRELREYAMTHDELWGVRIPRNEWVGPGATDEFDDGRGEDDDRQ